MTAGFCDHDSLSPELNLPKESQEVPQEVQKRSIKKEQNQVTKTHEQRVHHCCRDYDTLPSPPLEASATPAASRHLDRRLLPFGLFSFFILLWSFFIELTSFHLLPTKANKACKNPKDYIIIQAKIK